MKTNQEMLKEEIRLRLENVSTSNFASDKGQAELDGMCKLYNMAVEENDKNTKNELKSKELELEEKKVSRQKVDSYVKYGLDTAAIVLPLMAYGIWFNKGLKFEETGTFTSGMLKNIVGKFKPTLK